jgi:putative transcriptional regulator
MNKKSRNTTGTELGNKLLKSVREMKAGKVARSTQIAANEVAAARMKSGLSQKDFAQALQISPRTLQEWEQGRREPSGAAPEKAAQAILKGMEKKRYMIFISWDVQIGFWFQQTLA